jgi:hypothetical protein
LPRSRLSVAAISPERAAISPERAAISPERAAISQRKSPDNKKGPGNRGLEVHFDFDYRPLRARPKATSSFLQRPFSSGRLSWLRSSSIYSP